MMAMFGREPAPQATQRIFPVIVRNFVAAARTGSGAVVGYADVAEPRIGRQSMEYFMS
jgi:hypothetical protein